MEKYQPQKVDRYAYIWDESCDEDALVISHAIEFRVEYQGEEPKELSLPPDKQVHSPLKLVKMAIVTQFVLQV